MLHNNLPQQLTSFVGRERERADVIRLLASARLLTLTGAGGSGKTRLSQRVALDMAPTFEDGVCFVPLAPVRDPGLVISAIAQALGVREGSGSNLAESVKNTLLDSRMLLLLDNFEQVLPSASFIAQLLSEARYLKVLVTSREALGLYGEAEYPVLPLSIPGEEPESVGTLAQYDAVTLFIQRVQAHNPEFTLTEANALTVAQICQRVDGLPLAIELAAARVKVLPPRALLARLEKRLQLLTHGPSDLPTRHQTLRAAIDWSYDLLDDADSCLFRRLSVFIGGRSLEAIEAVCNSDPVGTVDVLEGVTSLLSKNLLIQREGVDGEARYFMLETIHEYAREKLRESGEEAILQNLHLDYFTALAAEAQPHIRGHAQEEWLARLEAEHANMRAAMDWSQRAAREPGGEVRAHPPLNDAAAEKSLLLVSALWQFWWVRGYYREGRKRLEDALSISGEPTGARCEALFGVAALAARQGDYAVAEKFYHESLEIARNLDDKIRIARSLNRLGILANTYKDHMGANLLLTESLEISRELGDERGIASALNPLGVMAWEREDYPQARILFEQTLEIYRKLGDTWGIALVLDNLGRVARDQGEHGAALVFHRESLEIKVKLGDKWGISASLVGIARAAWSQGAVEYAARLWGAEEALRQAIGTAMTRANLADHERDVAAARSQLDPGAWSDAWAAGRAMNMEQAVELALSDLPETRQPSPSPKPQPEEPYPNDLTRREVELLRLVAEGLTNQQIADRLFLSRNTVHAHLHSIYGKLNITTRSAAVHFAVSHNLV